MFSEIADLCPPSELKRDARLITARKRTTSSLATGILGKACSDSQRHRERHPPDEEALKPWSFDAAEIAMIWFRLKKISGLRVIN